MVSVSVRQFQPEATDRNAPATSWTAVRPVPGTPAWALPVALGERPPAKPWETWTLPAKRPAPFAITGPDTAPAQERVPWRIDFGNGEPARKKAVGTAPVMAAQEPDRRLAKRLVMLLGLAYLFLAALATGLAWTAHLETDDENEPEPDRRPQPLREPDPDPNAPGVHVRPDGSRYLVMRLPGLAPGCAP